MKVAADILEKGEKTIFREPKAIVLNEIQCSRLWRNLRVVYKAFAPSLSYVAYIRSEQQKYLPLFKEFYLTVLRADTIVKKCSCEESWLEAAVLYGDCRQVFQAFSLQLQACVESFHEISEELAKTFRIFEPSIDVAIRDDDADEDFRADARNLMARLEELSRQAGIGEKEKRLISYLMEREQNDSRKLRLDSNLRYVPLFYKVDRQDIKIEKNIGRGAFGVVSEVKWLGVPCAQKEFLEGGSEEDFEKEVCALLHLNHPSIAKLLCCCCEGSRPSLVMELMPLSLSEYIQEQKKNMQRLEGSMPFSIVAAISLMLQMALGMEYLHGQGVVHRDLKSSNILVSPWRHEGLRGEGYADLKLTDFGLAKMSVYDIVEPTRKMMGTSKWIAPEAVEALPSQRIDWRKADAYSFGITCSEILTGEVPYSTVKAREVSERVRAGLRPNLPRGCPSYLSNFLKRCWHEIPKERPCFDEIVKTLDGFKISLLKGTEPEYDAPSTKPPRLLENVKNFFQKLVHQRSLNRLVENPDPIDERFEATVASNHNSLEEAVSICNRMKELLDGVVICRVQCEYLVQNYQEGVRKIKSMSEHASSADMLILFRSNKLQQFSCSLDRLICSMLSVEELLQACGGKNWMMTALEILTPLPQPRTYSRFGILLWELYWTLFVIHHVMLDTMAQRSKTSPQLLAVINIGSNGAKIQWSEARCRLVLRSIVNYEGFVDEDDLEADADRLAEDRRNLLASLEEQFPPGAAIGLAGYLKRRLQSTSTSIDFVSHEKYYWIDELEFEEEEYIRNESFSPVYKSKWMGKSVAISILSDSRTDAPFCAGTEKLARLQHPNVVHLIGYGFHNGNSASGCSVMELVEEDLGSLIERNTRLYNGAPFPLMISVDILLQIVEAMVHVHECGELHRNLGPSNVLVHPKAASASSVEDINIYYVVKLTGFLRDGVVTKMPGSSDVLYDSSVRARGYMAPAMRNFPKEKYTQATDVWSFGWIAHDVVLGPFTLDWERNRPLLPDWCPQGLKELMIRCWGTNPQGRPSFEQIRKELMTIKYKEAVSSTS